jgi:hypothetical protein
VDIANSFALLMGTARRASTKTLVAVQVLGGLGNQLFIYAAGRGLAHRLGADLILDATNRRLPRNRAFCLDRFSIRAPITFDGPPKVRGRYFKLPGRLGSRIADHIHAVVPSTVQINGHRFRVVEERERFVYDNRFDGLRGSIYLKGFWQSYRFFEHAADIIRTELKPSVPLSETTRKWVERIRQTNSVCVHVRRGDYLQTSFGLCPPSYYAEAVRVIRERVEHPTFFVFSDDLPWCRDNLPIDGMVLVADASPPDDPVSELLTMATCRHQIIANSTFSWWAAWLARHGDQVVAAPEPWISICSSSVDLLPSNWIRLARS